MSQQTCRFGSEPASGWFVGSRLWKCFKDSSSSRCSSFLMLYLLFASVVDVKVCRTGSLTSQVGVSVCTVIHSSKQNPIRARTSLLPSQCDARTTLLARHDPLMSTRASGSLSPTLRFGCNAAGSVSGSSCGTRTTLLPTFFVVPSFLLLSLTVGVQSSDIITRIQT